MIPRWSALAENAGFSTLSTIGRVAYPGVMDTVALAVAAGATTRISLLSGVLLGGVWPSVLLAKEIAGIDAVSGQRLTLGLGIGARPDDFVVEDRPGRGIGARLDRDLQTYRAVWNGDPVGGGPNAAVPAGSRQVPLVFGGRAPAALERMARHGKGYIANAMPAPMVSRAFGRAQTAWTTAGREGRPYLIASAYFAFADVDAGRRNIGDYFAAAGVRAAQTMASRIHHTADEVRTAVKALEEAGADEVLLLPATDDLLDLATLAETIL